MLLSFLRFEDSERKIKAEIVETGSMCGNQTIFINDMTSSGNLASLKLDPRRDPD